MEKDNKLIAEFMGCTHPFNEITDATLYNVSHGTFELSELRYDVSWNWLMPVVHKCYQEHTCSQERMNSNDAYEIKTCDITRVYKAVVKFIKDTQHEWR